MAHYKRHRPNPKHDTYGGWTVEGKQHRNIKQPQVHDSTVVSRVKRLARLRMVTHAGQDNAQT